MIEVHETIGMLFRYGPTSEAIARSRNFWELHRKYAAWMPKSISLKLDPFETAINEIGVKTHLVEAWGSEQPEQRSNALSESYAVFANVMSLGEISGISPERKREIAVENVKEEIRNILGINELFEIRNFIVKRSIAYVETRT